MEGGAAPPREAFVTLATNDTYSLGCLVLANSLRRVGTTRELVVMITPGVTATMRNQLSRVFDLIYDVDILDSKDEANLGLLGRPDLNVTFTKLHCWRLTQYSKAVFLDADTLVLQNVDELFEREELSAAPDAGWPDCFNSGVFVFKPSEETYIALINFAVSRGSFDGGDQGLLNLYFKDWATKDINKHLPFIYNVVSQAFYSYLPAFTQFKDTIKIVHFIGEVKPWHHAYNTSTGRVQPLKGTGHSQEFLQLWWNIFMEMVHPYLDPTLTPSLGSEPRSGRQGPPEDCPSPATSDSAPAPKQLMPSSYPIVYPFIPPSVQTFYDPVHTEPPPPSPPPRSSTPQPEEGCSHLDAGASGFGGEGAHDSSCNGSGSSPDPYGGCAESSSGPTDEAPSTPQVIEVPSLPTRSYLHLETHYAEEPLSLTNHETTSGNLYNANKLEPTITPQGFQKENIVKDRSEISSDQNESNAGEETTKESKKNELIKVEEKLGGLVGDLASLQIAYSASGTAILTDRERRLAWERGQMDYLGMDKFENIKRKLDETLSPSPSATNTPPNAAASVSAVSVPEGPAPAPAEEVKPPQPLPPPTAAPIVPSPPESGGGGDGPRAVTAISFTPQSLAAPAPDAALALASDAVAESVSSAVVSAATAAVVAEEAEPTSVLASLPEPEPEPTPVLASLPEPEPEPSPNTTADDNTASFVLSATATIDEPVEETVSATFAAPAESAPAAVEEPTSVEASVVFPSAPASRSPGRPFQKAATIDQSQLSHSGRPFGTTDTPGHSMAAFAPRPFSSYVGSKGISSVAAPMSKAPAAGSAVAHSVTASPAPSAEPKTSVTAKLPPAPAPKPTSPVAESAPPAAALKTAPPTPPKPGTPTSPFGASLKGPSFPGYKGSSTAGASPTSPGGPPPTAPKPTSPTDSGKPGFGSGAVGKPSPFAPKPLESSTAPKPSPFSKPWAPVPKPEPAKPSGPTSPTPKEAPAVAPKPGAAGAAPSLAASKPWERPSGPTSPTGKEPPAVAPKPGAAGSPTSPPGTAPKPYTRQQSAPTTSRFGSYFPPKK